MFRLFKHSLHSNIRTIKKTYWITERIDRPGRIICMSLLHHHKGCSFLSELLSSFHSSCSLIFKPGLFFFVRQWGWCRLFWWFVLVKYLINITVNCTLNHLLRVRGLSLSPICRGIVCICRTWNIRGQFWYWNHKCFPLEFLLLECFWRNQVQWQLTRLIIFHTILGLL